MDVKRKAVKIFSAEEQPKILRCGQRRIQISNTRYEIQLATFYKSAVGAKKEPPCILFQHYGCLIKIAKAV
jgi:hypothetical protein